MTVEYVNGCANVPEAIGPYSQATVVGNMIFLSGQIPIDPATGKIVDGGVENQAEQVMKNLSCALEHFGLSFQHVAKTGIFLKSMDDFGAVNEIYGKWMGDCRPARATIEAGKLPLDVRVEIEMIAVRG